MTLREAIRASHDALGINWANGHYESGLTCRQCGKALDGPNGNNPAETYAGTYNGLCYPCTSAQGYITHVDVLDDALHWSYPPHLPSWRRDREHQIGYADCRMCGGGGFSWAHGQHVRHRVACRPCMVRHSQHPGRQHRYELQRMLAEAAQRSYEAGICRLVGRRPRTRKGAQKIVKQHIDDLRGTPELQELQTDLLTRHHNLQALLKERYAFLFEQRPPTEEELAIEPAPMSDSQLGLLRHLAEHPWSPDAGWQWGATEAQTRGVLTHLAERGLVVENNDVWSVA